MSNFKIEIASVPDREKLVAEVWYSETMVAEINQESESLKIEFYLEKSSSFNFYELLEILEMAKNRLLAG